MAVKKVKKKISPGLSKALVEAWSDSYMYGLYSRLSEVDRVITKKGKGLLSFYWEMVDSDSVLAGLIDTRIDNVAALDREIVAASEEADHERHAEFTRDALAELSRFDEDLEEILSACVTGYSMSEIIWREWEWEGQPRLIPAKIQSVNPDRFELKGGEWFLKPSIRASAGQPISDYPYKFIVHTFRERFQNKRGISLLKSIYWVWWFKHNAFEFWMRAAEVGAEITPVILYEENASEDEIDEMHEAAEKFLKAKSYVGPNKGKIEFPHIKIDREFASTLVEKTNQEMRYRILGSTLSSGTDQSGSRALGIVHAEKEQERKEHDAKCLAATLNTTLLQWMIELNFGEQNLYPKIKFAYETARDQSQIRENLKLGVEFGVPMTKTYVASALQIEMADPDVDPSDLLGFEWSETETESEDEEEIEEPELEPEEEAAELAHIIPRARAGIDKRIKASKIKREKLIKGAIRAGEPVYEHVTDEIEDWLDKYDSIEEALEHFKDFKISVKDLQKYISESYFFANLHGMFQVYDDPKVKKFLSIEAPKKSWLQVIRERFMDQDSLWEPVPFDEAIEIFRDREILTMEDFKALEAAAKRHALTATGMSYKTIKGKLRDALEVALVEGITFPEFHEMVKDKVMSTAHAETIFRTNVLSAYNSGHAEAIYDPALADAIPAFEYRAIMDDRTTVICQERDGMIYSRSKLEDWDIIPPCHFSCRSTVVEVFADEFKGKLSGKPTERAQEGFGKFKSVLH